MITDLNNEHLNHHNMLFNNIKYSKNEVDMLSCFKAIGSHGYKMSELINSTRQDPNNPNFHDNILTDPKQIKNKMRNIPDLPTQKFTDINKINNLFKVFDEGKNFSVFCFKMKQ